MRLDTMRICGGGWEVDAANETGVEARRLGYYDMKERCLFGPVTECGWQRQVGEAEWGGRGESDCEYDQGSENEVDGVRE
jgi:hypothetical protein